MFGSLAIMVLTMMFSFDSFLRTTWITCLLQVNDPILFHLRELTPLVSRRYCGIAPPFMNPYWCDTFHRFFASTGSGLSSTENTESILFTIPFLDVVAIRWHPLKSLDMMCRGPHHPWIFPSVY